MSLSGQQMLEDHKAADQRRLNEARNCRVVGYWTCAAAILGFVLAGLLSHFGIVSEMGVAVPWIMGLSAIVMIFSFMCVLIGCAEAY